MCERISKNTPENPEAQSFEDGPATAAGLAVDEQIWPSELKKAKTKKHVRMVAVALFGVPNAKGIEGLFPRQRACYEVRHASDLSQAAIKGESHMSCTFFSLMTLCCMPAWTTKPLPRLRSHGYTPNHCPQNRPNLLVYLCNHTKSCHQT